MNYGDIVLAEFPFTDLKQNKIRPVLIISSNDLNCRKDDVIVVFISSIMPDNPSNTEYIINESDVNFPLTGLKRSSVFRMDKIMTIEKNIIKRILGKASPKLMDILKAYLKIALSL